MCLLLLSEPHSPVLAFVHVEYGRPGQVRTASGIHRPIPVNKPQPANRNPQRKIAMFEFGCVCDQCNSVVSHNLSASRELPMISSQELRMQRIRAVAFDSRFSRMRDTKSLDEQDTWFPRANSRSTITERTTRHLLKIQSAMSAQKPSANHSLPTIWLARALICSLS